MPFFYALEVIFMENNIKINSTKRLTLSALVIALYVVIMFCTQSFAFGQFQIRIATTIYSLSYIFPFLVLPLGIANIISNTIMGGLGVLDMLGGGLVGITTSFLIVLIRKYKLNINLAAIPIIFVPSLIGSCSLKLYPVINGLIPVVLF